MSAHPKQSTRPRREPATATVTIEYDRDRSTPFNELYHADSDSEPGLRHEVRYDVERDRWTCDPATCRGFRRYLWCRHCQRCRQHRAIRRWSAIYLGAGRPALEIERAKLRLRVMDGTAHEDDLDALDFLNLRLDYDGRKVAA